MTGETEKLVVISDVNELVTNIELVVKKTVPVDTIPMDASMEMADLIEQELGQDPAINKYSTRQIRHLLDFEAFEDLDQTQILHKYFMS